ncbi:cyanophycin synthetase [Caulobacter endophyticus]|uniref:Cyanophycin synthetase n=1 Tax=Caulobacter endophyticus TaxID=2172652 RepID=A0A2T9KCH9_9CAUL|nr:cyanophycin synthetase [Caulobacter endophyticus]PVM93658.1 cyanophycin synthetase [Caulobacter endophyticus]
MRVLETAVYRGPHLYSARPMIRIQLDLGQLEGHPTSRLPGFADRLLQALPGLAIHGCSLGAPGGLVARLHDGTWIGHVVEHVALELQTLAGAATTRGKTRSVRGRRGVYDILYVYEGERLGRAAGRAALALVRDLLPPELKHLEGLDSLAPPPIDAMETPFDLPANLEALRRIARAEALGPTTRSIVQAARRRGVPVQRLDDYSLIQLGYGVRRKLLRASITGDTSHVAVQTAGDKALTKRMLNAAGVPAPRGAVVHTADAAVAEAARFTGPVVVKPLDGNHGRGVSLGLSTPEAVRWGFEQAVRHSRKVIVEEQYTGRDYRILVVGGKVAAVAERVPAQVVGDGVSTVADLVARENADPRRGIGHEKVMTRIVIDDHVRNMLERQGLAVASTPAAGVCVSLRATANLSTGGTAIDRTDDIHPENAAIARRAALTVGLDVAGIDFIAPDIARSVRETGGGVVEVNAAPGFRMHLEPSEGSGRDVGGAVVEQLFPRRSASRVPIVAITGTNGKSTVGRMVAAILRADGRTVGLTNTSGVYIGEERVTRGDASGPRSARMVLSAPTVEAAVLETARGGLLREGLAFDRCDVGVVLNVSADHLGLKGIDTLEDLAAVKSVIVEAVFRRGVSVLNADDPLTLRMARRARGRIAYFTLRGGPDLPPFLQKHLAEGGLAATLEPSVRGGALVLFDRGRRIPLLEADALPSALAGAARFNLSNALAAALAARGLGVAIETIAAALSGFQSSAQDNPGRLNVADIHGFRVIVDYAHNPGALEAVGEMVARLREHHGRAIGVVSIPGDRRDEDIRRMGAIAASLFDELVLRERPDGRGRPAGSVIALLREGALSEGFPESRLHRVPSEPKAVEHALGLARPGDLLMIFPTAVERVWAQIHAFSPASQETIEASDAGAVHG